MPKYRDRIHPKITAEYKSPAGCLEISDEKLIKLSEEGLLALNLENANNPSTLQKSEIRSAREALGLPPVATDVEWVFGANSQSIVNTKFSQQK